MKHETNLYLFPPPPPPPPPSGGSRNSKLGWPDPHLFLDVVALCYYYLGVELTEKSTATGTEKKRQK